MSAQSATEILKRDSYFLHDLPDWKRWDHPAWHERAKTVDLLAKTTLLSGTLFMGILLSYPSFVVSSILPPSLVVGITIATLMGGLYLLDQSYGEFWQDPAYKSEKRRQFIDTLLASGLTEAIQQCPHWENVITKETILKILQEEKKKVSISTLVKMGVIDKKKATSMYLDELQELSFENFVKKYGWTPFQEGHLTADTRTQQGGLLRDLFQQECCDSCKTLSEVFQKYQGTHLLAQAQINVLFIEDMKANHDDFGTLYQQYNNAGKQEIWTLFTKKILPGNFVTECAEDYAKRHSFADFWKIFGDKPFVHFFVPQQKLFREWIAEHLATVTFKDFMQQYKCLQKCDLLPQEVMLKYEELLQEWKKEEARITNTAPLRSKGEQALKIHRNKPQPASSAKFREIEEAWKAFVAPPPSFQPEEGSLLDELD